MRKSIFTLAAVSAAALTLSACGNEAADADGDGEISAEEASDAMSDIKMTPGEYEVKASFTEIEVEGMPEAAKKAMLDQMGNVPAQKMCVTEEMAANPGAGMFGGAEESGCTMDKLERSGSDMEVAMTCKVGEMSVVSNMEGTMEAESYTMNIEQTMTGGPTGDMKMKGTVEGKRVGDCPA
ncbi:DUF3617 domain-containing protein [Alterisphingorhabdus coralli]|uniref:DUF3617 domain-containing protein n=1 Tax=Alterisphingorhabdus coralli TaxID=3071408 RepID=A0AA97I201_9SPHN|nr:DUF3617 domain-containing protein [Parasphingorhabdus sp. SCSIO 66989]WOE75798.1 DUF3617 domain-containing protein [Parasphingorhabdus sp. SCSIO 66989]